MSQRMGISAGAPRRRSRHQQVATAAVWIVMGCLVSAMAPEWAFAGTSPFTTGATATQTNVLAILTPIAVVAVMAIGAAAWFNKISWGWGVAAIVGICLVFGAPQIVTWARGMFGV